MDFNHSAILGDFAFSKKGETWTWVVWWLWVNLPRFSFTFFLQQSLILSELTLFSHSMLFDGTAILGGFWPQHLTDTSA